MTDAREIDPGTLLARRLGMFVDLDAAEVAAIVAAVSPARSVSAPRDLIHEGAAPGSTLLIVSGWACRYKTLEDGRRQIVALLVPGDISDLHSTLLSRMDHSIGALRTVRYAEVPEKALRQLTADYPRVEQALWRQMLVSISIQREWTTNIGQRNALERVGHLLCELYVRLRAVGLVSGDSYAFPLTQIDVAGATGLTPVHVNRTIRQLKTLGLIGLSEHSVTIPSFAALTQASLFTPDYLHLPVDHRQDDHPPFGTGANP